MVEIIYLNNENEVVSKEKATKYERITFDINNRMISREYGGFDGKQGYDANPKSITNR